MNYNQYVLSFVLGLFAGLGIANCASAQYGNPYDPYLDYQREIREQEMLRLQQERNDLIRQEQFRRDLEMLQPRRQDVQPMDPYYRGY